MHDFMARVRQASVAPSASQEVYGRPFRLERIDIAHAFAAMCHHNLFLRSGLLAEHRARPIQHAEKAIARA